MVKQSKKQSLLGKVPAKNKKRSPDRIKKKPTNSQSPTATAQASVASASVESKPKSKVIWIVGTILVLVFVLFPKPQLITYEKLGLVAESVYWPGVPGVSPVLFDSHLHPQPALDKNTLYLCHNVKDPDTCQKYQIVKQQGTFAAVMRLLDL
ncbi:hypothetical protein ACSLBF_11965 [Pseudoalteromonas sp. T1lg65]|uniref:hypothetical protein n=1 Tax=Pseudoalteromonas sp. T1lg65 TaxID=2077101 RepID=UPI003F7A0BEE